MGNSEWQFRKPYDLRERLFEFACAIVRLSQLLQQNGGTGAALSEQILRSGTSAGANYEEADDGSSPRDSTAKMRIALRELKETRFRLRVLRECDVLTSEHDPVLLESDELVRILATIIRKRA
jgi:four helix bundle protein